MVVAFKNSLGSNVATAGGTGTTLVITTTAAIAVGDLVVVRVATDNTNATTPTFTCADSGSNSYTTHVQGGVNATAAAGVVGAIMAAKATTAVSTGGTITITLTGVGSGVAHRAAYATSFTGADNTLRVAAVKATGTATAQSSGASASANSGDLAIGAAAIESRTAPSAYDTDTAQGTWQNSSVTPSTTTGTATSAVEIAGQYKILTGAGTQTYDTTGPGTEWLNMLLIFQATPTPLVTQAAYRFYDDNGSESTSTALGTQDTANTQDFSVTGDKALQLRIRLQETNAVAVPSTDDWQIQYSKNGAAFADMNSGTFPMANTSSSLTDGAATTNRLTGGTGTFVAGKICEDGLADDVGWTASNYTELLYAVYLHNSAFAHGDQITFRLLKNGVTTDMTYTVTPTINVTKNFLRFPARRPVALTYR